VFQSNTAGSAGGAIRVLDLGTSITLTSCTFADNISVNSGGGDIATHNAWNFEIWSCTFERAQSEWFGGSLSFLDSNCVVFDSTISGASSAYGGGGLWMSNGVITLWETQFINCSAADQGGGVLVFNSVCTFFRGLFKDNTAVSGGGLALTGTSEGAELEDVHFCGNSPDAISGGWTEVGEVCIDDCPECCPADLNGDGVISVDDLLLLISYWGQAGGDINGDGTTNVDDLLELLTLFGQPC
jgi:hypothetical protein